jgi:hypothetical protein
MAKKKTTKAVSDDLGEPGPGEKRSFMPDDETTNEGKNGRLAALLNGVWNPLAIVRVDRVEIGPQPGWWATYRE